MDNLRLPKQDSATGRGIKTGLQAVIGTLVAFIVGLVLAVLNVPGVNEAILQYVEAHLIQTLLTIGIPAGLTGFVWNLLRKGVSNY